MKPAARPGPAMLLLLALILACALRCGDAPTEPTSQDTLNLNGAWSGTINLGGPSQRIRLTLSHSGATVSGLLTTDLEGALKFQGTLRSGRLTVDLLRESGSSIARLEGTASSTSIHVGGSSLNDSWISIDLSR